MFLLQWAAAEVTFVDMHGHLYEWHTNYPHDRLTEDAEACTS